jgi:hypothetical protein
VGVQCGCDARCDAVAQRDAARRAEKASRIRGGVHSRQEQRRGLLLHGVPVSGGRCGMVQRGAASAAEGGVARGSARASWRSRGVGRHRRSVLSTSASSPSVLGEANQATVMRATGWCTRDCACGWACTWAHRAWCAIR